MHKIVSLSLDERIVDLLDDEIIRNPIVIIGLS
jgi:hypothetical protein